MNFIIGVDAGGTKTAFVLYDIDGNIVDSRIGPTCHYMQLGYEKMAAFVATEIKVLLNEHSIEYDDVGVCLGMAGYGREVEVCNNINHALKKALESISFLVYSDVEVAMAGALNGEDGIVVIAGTGSIAFSLQDGKRSRSGGWGFAIGDEGSAYWIAKQAMSIFAKQADGICEKTALYSAIKQGLSLQEDFDLISYVNVTLENKRDKIATLAMYVYEAAQVNDVEALKIYDAAAHELALLVNTLAKQFSDTKIPVSYIGGVFKAKEYILTPFQNCLDERLQVAAPAHSPEYGAYILAKKQFVK